MPVGEERANATCLALSGLDWIASCSVGAATGLTSSGLKERECSTWYRETTSAVTQPRNNLFGLNSFGNVPSAIPATSKLQRKTGLRLHGDLIGHSVATAASDFSPLTSKT